ncbi:hypothetical protein SPRG_00037 [Saprolegnia parasitica CBS 223.65]|uniref:Uncharacterized protein n=1 Tax=Saprolegnia parasitica (strain CBS 223.65) TaxID=695850 RepID=A0A067D9A7_SAPPC|nr:hypothetical protein SPRG_00037 [Saprolegnia parasitica CBS 223.65]KDO35191.1 hypothetical protein SPRG_00037 [Saprolegnia parasitica CBS 223.65]|eukprot:XP_012193543.1 hypothetical protein SPRG_00037 [Saprolegnia parasitica CBS 223.65]
MLRGIGIALRVVLVLALLSCIARPVFFSTASVIEPIFVFPLLLVTLVFSCRECVPVACQVVQDACKPPSHHHFRDQPALYYA